jgi:acetyltransferase-like isoleucine patch superfamily enzyme
MKGAEQLNPSDVPLNDEQKKIWEQLRDLHFQLREHTWTTYKRVNPFSENLYDWKEKGAFFGGKDVTIYDSTTIVGEIDIGDHTWIGPFCSLDGTAGLSIGRYCSISAGTHILTHDSARWALSGGSAQYDYSPVRIGNNCFVGTHAVITKGVTIGNHCVIGAGSIVTSDIPDNSIVFGVPGRVAGKVFIQETGEIEFEFFEKNRSDTI